MGTVAIRSHVRRKVRHSWSRQSAHMMTGAGADSQRPSYTPAGTTRVLAPYTRVLEINVRNFAVWLQATNDALWSSGLNSGHTKNDNSNWPEEPASCSCVQSPV
ncbi:unnamed protein product [Schistocephalus solidus]|uniref:Uncharacterized protein n=1 Tax=Schistocephalus solidus TaxID=70667 RepID=A0A183SPL1_SCHSO|nr:unnamed protein product [Schistocephalus solidus]